MAMFVTIFRKALRRRASEVTIEILVSRKSGRKSTREKE